MSLRHAYEMERYAAERGYLCDEGCTGRWVLSDFDTWHACPHGDPGMHPEAAEDLHWMEKEATEASSEPKTPVDPGYPDDIPF